MKILYDHQIFTGQKFGGISRYFYELMNHSEDLFEYDVSGIYSENEYIKQLRLYKEFPLKISFRGKGRILNLLNKSHSIKKIRQKDYDIIHPTYYDPYLLKSIKNVPLVINVHDMIFEKLPEYFNKNDNTAAKKRECFIKSDAIIATSQKTKDDLIAIHPEICEEKVKVIYHGEVFSEKKHNSEKRNYILFTGQRGAYKNFNSFIEAVAPLLIRYNLRLLCTGQAFTKDEYALLSRHKIADKTKAVFASETELQDIYTKALLFVFPSLYEGFGFPILEAFASGCPAVLSGTSCFPEIAEDAAVYFDPYSADDMRDKIEKVLLDSSLQSTLIKRGFERVKFFSWEKTVKQTYQLYCELLSPPPRPTTPPLNRPCDEDI
jgi:glycosyltransferase involved in cell wall biosynthesis